MPMRAARRVREVRPNLATSLVDNATLTLESLTRLENTLRILLSSSTLDHRTRDAFRVVRATLAYDDWLSAYDGGPIAVARARLKIRIHDILGTLEERP